MLQLFKTYLNFLDSFAIKIKKHELQNYRYNFRINNSF